MSKTYRKRYKIMKEIKVLITEEEINKRLEEIAKQTYENAMKIFEIEK